MPVAPLVGAGIITGIGALAGGAMASSGAKSAARTQSEAAARAAQLQTDAANHAADLEAANAKAALDFQKEQAALLQRNSMNTQAFNRQVYTDQQQRLAPYRAAGAGAIGQLGQPIPGGQ